MIDENKLIKEIKNRRDFWLSKASKYAETEDEINTDICDGKLVEKISDAGNRRAANQ